MTDHQTPETFRCPFFYVQTSIQEGRKTIYRLHGPTDNVCRAKVKYSDELKRWALQPKGKTMFHVDCLGHVSKLLKMLEAS